MADADEDVGALLLWLIGELQALNIRVGTLREVLQTDLGISDDQYAAALAKATAASQLLEPPAPPGRPRTKH